jgi:two-component system phosphate regulon response regulator PhoB
VLSHNLKAEGYVVESVDSGDEAVRKLAGAPPDLVILDWMSSGMSGPEICSRLRAEDATRMLPIIMLSARGRKSCATFNSTTRPEGCALARRPSEANRIPAARMFARAAWERLFSPTTFWSAFGGNSVDVTDRAVDVHIGRLRKALSTGRERDPILCVRGAGYSFDETFGKPLRG